MAGLDADGQHDPAHFAKYAAYAGGMPGGINNPLGARRALSLSRQHGYQFPSARNDRARNHWHGSIQWLHPSREP